MTAKPYRIEWRPMAREDLRAIVRYIGMDNPTRAKSFGKELRDKTKPLAQHPELGRKGRPGLPEWLRELVVHPNYVIFYRVLAKARTVEILRVKHAAQRVP
ncbi:type II toxin-antitoxin system RelE/ParE family toxin [Variovorax sp. WS11]|uniref:type II toxin-antitoxin system RelE/ParE family toxin n=1 Tax=Variovorax sp. WS11 TaxID=1105204 RepID=UPI000D0DFF72|nr:type II toxin-antitoxin system RelE/ParE family toxin [Variovorax sp. WS11]NDZ18987.1 type II toxin-antitoxin system RelE/ParE family toxin [Variovorax sp. WS11]PSL82493.1 type II toxin-antitoxin system RelE/ParE family toxin [Variovorax sp. WS11]